MNEELTNKKDIWRNIMSNKLASKRARRENSYRNEANIIENYGLKMNEKHERERSMKERISKLEERETALLQRL